MCCKLFAGIACPYMTEVRQNVIETNFERCLVLVTYEAGAF